MHIYIYIYIYTLHIHPYIHTYEYCQHRLLVCMSPLNTNLSTDKAKKSHPYLKRALRNQMQTHMEGDHLFFCLQMGPIINENLHLVGEAKKKHCYQLIMFHQCYANFQYHFILLTSHIHCLSLQLKYQTYLLDLINLYHYQNSLGITCQKP